MNVYGASDEFCAIKRASYRTAAYARPASTHRSIRPLDLDEVNAEYELLDLCVDDIDADERLSLKTCYHYRVSAETDIRLLLGKRMVLQRTRSACG